MLYRQAKGNMWDTSIVYHDGKYYLFSMYETEEDTDNTRVLNEPANNMWCAISEDGVIWKDVGAVIQDQPFSVWKMFVRRLGDKFIMNHGSHSKTPGHGNDTLYFWESDDLLTWRLFSENEESHPDPRWYRPEGRWDHMYMLPDEISGGYLGYCVATPHQRYPYPACGLLQSSDGTDWQVLPPPVIDWGDTPAPGGYEVGGCERENGKYYLIGGTDRYGDGQGYGVYTLVSDHWNGPFRPDPEAYRLCGTTGYPGVVGVQWLASFGRGKDNELLITNYLTDNIKNYSKHWGRFGWVWFLPIKKAIIDSEGHLRMGYWQENERLKGTSLKPGKATLVYPDTAGEHLTQESPHISLDSSRDGSDNNRLFDEFAIVTLETTLDLEKGAVIEGTLTIDAYNKNRPTKAGFYFEESETSGTYVLLENGDPRWRKSDIGGVEWGTHLHTELRDVTQYGAATVTGITNKQPHRFRIFYRRNMFEVYIDDLLMQTFITARTPTGRIGFIVQNARCVYSDVQMWEMKL